MYETCMYVYKINQETPNWALLHKININKSYMKYLASDIFQIQSESCNSGSVAIERCSLRRNNIILSTPDNS